MGLARIGACAHFSSPEYTGSDQECPPRAPFFCLPWAGNACTYDCRERSLEGGRPWLPLPQATAM
eukprot:1131654-Pyramimonas_sp.AAC.1